MHREREDLRFGADLTQLPRRVDAAHLAHGDIHDRDVRAQARRFFNGLPTIRRLAHDHHVRLRFDQAFQPFAHHGVIVSEENL